MLLSKLTREKWSGNEVERATERTTIHNHPHDNMYKLAQDSDLIITHPIILR